MPRAEVGSNKYIANKMKSKGLQRLRWFCQACEKQCRDANGFKCHVQSESHVRQMAIIGEDPRKAIQGFSNEFQSAFVNQLRVSHGEKFIGANRFYNEYIRDKEHLHMNATKWASLTEFVKHLTREGIVSFKEDEKDGILIAYRDNSVQAIRRREELRQKELEEARGAGEEKTLLKQQKRAEAEAAERRKAAEARRLAQAQKASESQKAAESQSPATEAKTPEERAPTPEENGTAGKDGETANTEEAPAPVKISFGLKPKTLPTNKPGLGTMKSQSIFKRARTGDKDEKPGKKVKL